MKKEDNKEYATNLDKKAITALSEPTLYQVYISNDDFTPMEYVVGILEKFFFLDRRKATEIMYEAHVQGRAICGLFSKDFAESKISQVITHARTYEHPLLLEMEAL